MAFPLVKIDNTGGGSDTQASGAGPATAIYGSNAYAAGVFRVGIFDDPAPDISGVATDGSAAVWVNNTATGAKQWSKITGVDNTRLDIYVTCSLGSPNCTTSDTTGLAAGQLIRLNAALDGEVDLITYIVSVTNGTQFVIGNDCGAALTDTPSAKPKQFTVATSIGGTYTAWAVGGKRATLAGSLRLLENNAAAGDALAGWIVELQSGHDETLTAAVVIRVDGNVTDGTFIFRGTPGAATRPIIKRSNSGTVLACYSKYARISDMDIKTTYTSANSSAYVVQGATAYSYPCEYVNLKLDGNTKHGYGFYGWASVIRNCSVTGNTVAGIQVSGGPASDISACRIYGNAIGLLAYTYFTVTFLVRDCVIIDNTSNGVEYSYGSGTGTNPGIHIERCVIAKNGGSGVKVTGTADRILTNIDVRNSVISGNSAYGIEFDGAVTLAQMQFYLANIYNDCFGHADSTDNYGKANTSGTINAALTGLLVNCLSTNPQFTNAAAGNFAVGTNLKAAGYPSVIGYGGTTTTLDIGIQRAEPAANGGGEHSYVF